ncbi:MAG: DUF3794 domain-containing protein [Firmicutes bacterium]|nr:DUF3794 domain-containing protein [Bacillota bacterium]
MSCYCYSPVTGKQQVRATTEKIKVLKVIGEKVGQVVVESNTKINAVKIDRIHADIRDVTDHVFKDKVVKQGTIHKQIFYVDPEGVVRELQERIPFMMTVDIPGIKRTPFTDVQNHLLDIDTDYVLEPATGAEYGNLMQKIVAHILVKVSEWVQLDVVTKVDVFPKINASSRIDYCKKY